MRPTLLSHVPVFALVFCAWLPVEAQPGECTCNPLFFCANTTIETHHQIDNHPDFSTPIEFGDPFCASIEFYHTIRVTADGKKATRIRLDPTLCCDHPVFDETSRMFIVLLDDNGEPMVNTDPQEYGRMVFEDFDGSVTTYAYFHPTNLPAPGEMSRNVTWVIYQAGQSSNMHGPYGGIHIQILRPPVVMIHGLWSDASAFATMEAEFASSGEYEPYQLYVADYSGTNASSFQTNGDVVRNAIIQVVENCAANGLSAGKVNVVAHSMGGLLTRKYLQDPGYDNRLDINRLITCNTPHGGSQMADFLLDQNQYGLYISDVLTAAGMNCYAGAVENLRVAGSAIQSVQAGAIGDNVEVRSIITDSDAVNYYVNLFATAMAKINVASFAAAMLSSCTQMFIDDVFDLDDNDAIVAVESQEGGLSGPTTTYVHGQLHTGSVANAAVITHVADQLSQPPGSTYYTSDYSAVFLSYSFDFPCVPLWEESEEVQTRSNNTISLHIDSPASGTEVFAGEEIAIEYTATMLDTVVFAMQYTGDSLAIISNTAAAGEIDFTIPLNALGKKTLIAMGFDSDNVLRVHDTIHLQVVTEADLVAIHCFPEQLFLSQNDSMYIRVKGEFSDGIIRDLTSHPDSDYTFSLDNAVHTQNGVIRLEGDSGDTLRLSMGAIESNPILINCIGREYEQGCTMVTNVLNSGPGSLRYALECAEPNDTIFFDAALAGDTIVINDILEINKTLAIVNTHVQKIVIASTGSPRILRISSEVDVYIDHLELISDDPSMVAIVNNGNLVIENVRLTNTFMGISAFHSNEAGTITVRGGCELE